MKIVIINHYSGSPEQGMEYRHYYLAKEFQALGHDVVIVASRFSHLRNLQPPDQHEKWVEHCGIRHLWLAGCKYHGNGIRRLFNMIGFAVDLWFYASQIARQQKPDIVIASSPHPFCSYGATKMARAANAKLIFEIRDLWPLSLIELGSMSHKHFFLRMLDQAEAYGCRHAYKIVSLLPCVHEYMAMRGVAENKWVSIPNGVSLSGWQKPWSNLSNGIFELIIAFKKKGFTIVGYAGSHGVANALDTLLDAAKLVVGENIVFLLVGAGHKKAALKQRAKFEEINNVYFMDPIKREEIPALLQYFDIAYIGWHQQPMYRYGIAPNKLMDYMMAGRPVLHSVEAGNDPVSETKCGITVNPEDPLAVVQGIRDLLSLSVVERQEMGKRGQEYVVNNHTYSVLALRFLVSAK